MTAENIAHKTCNPCGLTKPIEAFPNGPGKTCRDCKKLYLKNYYYRGIKKGRKIAHKTCVDCGQAKPRADFACGTKDELREYCAACRDERNKRRYANVVAARLRYLQSITHAYQQSQLTCKVCGETKDADQFAGVRRKGGERYHYSRCKDCYNTSQRESRSQERGLDMKHFRRAQNYDATAELVRRADIIKRDGLVCYLCGTILAKGSKGITLDHVVPLSRGGTHTSDNLRVACKSCNSRKQQALLTEIDWPVAAE